MRGIFATVGAFMLVDAVISHVVSTDQRPGIQAGRFLRGALGVGLGALAISRE